MTLTLAILCTVAGILSVSVLPSVHFSYCFPLVLAISLFALPVFFRQFSWLKKLQLFGYFAIGIAWGAYTGQAIVAQQLSIELEGQDFLIEGIVSDLSKDKTSYQRFSFSLDQYSKSNSLNAIDNDILPKTLLLSWYGSESMSVGDRWRLKVRLKRPRGSVNEGGFDYQRWLLSQGYGATGYIKKSTSNQHLESTSQYSINQFRENIRDWINQYNNGYLSGVENKNSTYYLLIALAVGDNSFISQNQWQLLRQTGTSHLMAISGLHIGLVAFFGFFLGIIIRALLLLPFSFVAPIYYLPTIASIFCAVSYAALAGFSLPTQRALIMVLVANVALVIHRKVGSFLPFIWALLIVVMIDPLAGYELGFWLSFSAVGSLLYAFGYRSRANINNDMGMNSDGKERQKDRLYSFSLFMTKALLWIKQLTKSQWIVFIGLLLPLTLLNQSSGYLTPIANLFAIPWVSFTVVIPLLLAVLLKSLSLLLQPFDWLSNCIREVSEMLLHLADVDMSICWRLLERLLSKDIELTNLFAGILPSFYQVFDAANSPQGFIFLVAVVLAIVGVMLLLAPKGIPFKRLGILLVLPLFFSKSFSFSPLLPKYFSNQDPLVVTVLDVGQGLSVVVKVGNKTLLYDTGPGNNDGFNAGDAIVLPYLRSQSITHLDTLIVSHNDNDHAGGTMAVLKSLPVIEQIIYGEKTTWKLTQDLIQRNSANISPSTISMEVDKNYLCNDNQHWIWGEVDFYLIEPKGSGFLKDKNNQSCVLMISYKEQYILLTGDIEKVVEQTLLRDKQLPSGITLLVAPHHGSNTSSSMSFVNYLKPKAVVFSAGFNSRYGHPHPKVVARYNNVTSRLFNTGDMGQVEFHFDKEGIMTAKQWRKDHQRYWFSPE